MKKLYTLVSVVLLSTSLWAQAPQKMSYQAVIRGVNNALVIDKLVGVHISILQGSETGTAVYTETHTPTTNANGLVSFSIGAGKNPSSDFSKIDWSKGPYFVKTETDVEGGTNYQLTSVSELMSVPYALYAANSQPGPKGDKGDTGVQGPAGKDGAQGPAGNGYKNGTNPGEVMYWSGSEWVVVSNGTEGQSLTFCGGKPVWTIGGVCPGTVSSIDCNSAVFNGSLITGAVASGAKITISYTGGNGGSYTTQSITSTGVTGLTATLSAGNFANGAGNLTFIISGTPATIGTVSFSLNLGGKTCTLTGIVNSATQQPTSGFGPNISDVEGNTYKTVYIGTQQWMAENLKTAKYNDGTSIPNITDNSQWQNNTTGAWIYCNKDAANNAKYGKLYNWYVVNPKSNGNKNACPSGWHVPSEGEWTLLKDYLGGENIAGGKMKEVGTANWKSPNVGASNSSLFNALPGGWFAQDNVSNHMGSQAFWWTSTDTNTDFTWYTTIVSSYSIFSIGSNLNKKTGLSIRCLKD